MAELRLQLFGCLRIEVAGEPVHAQTRKAEALLVYLALHPGAPLRDEVAALLSDGATLSQQRATLRRHLAALRKVVGAEHLSSVDGRLQLTGVQADVLDMQARLGCLAGPPGARAPGNHGQARALAAALPAEGNTFLQGFGPRQCSGFERWRSAMAARLQRELQEALAGLAQWHAAHSEVSEALDWNRRLLQVTPLDEAAHRQQMQLLAQAGRRAEALAAYTALARSLDAELGSEPSAETLALRARILSEPTPPTQPDIPLSAPACACGPSPVAQPVVLGRDRQLEEAAERLLEPACRWLTIKGPGGVGKTAFAAALGHRLADAFSAGAHWFDASQRPARSRPRHWLRDHFQLVDSAHGQLLRGLRNKPMLLMVDELWVRTGEARALWACIAELPDIKVLATARERQRCAAEWLYELHGLEARPAQELFRRHAPEFSGTTKNMERLCDKLAGNPLALQLCAAWAARLPVDEMLTELERRPSFPDSRAASIPVRHRSMRAVFEESWQHLPEDGRACLRKLARLDADFAFSELRNVDPEQVLALRDASLLCRVPGRRLCVEPTAQRILRPPRTRR